LLNELFAVKFPIIDQWLDNGGSGPPSAPCNTDPAPLAALLKEFRRLSGKPLAALK
jgi:hypothetical protein